MFSMQLSYLTCRAQEARQREIAEGSVASQRS